MKKLNTITSIKNLANKNQIAITFSNGDRVFNSYSTNIAYYDSKKNIMYLDEIYYDYSKTTMKHLNMFLCESSIADVRKKIKSKEYILTNLNNN